jgi:pSer/pThr/pTyr-binding forkhead associated (FHA) protein
MHTASEEGRVGNQEAPFIEFDGDAAEPVLLTAEELSVGRSDDNDLCLSDPEVSRHHARFLNRDGGVAIEDLGSSNGTFVNGTRISAEVRLDDGDRVSFAGVEVTFHDVATEPPPTEEIPPQQPARPPLPLAALEAIGLPPVLLEADDTTLGRAVDNAVVLEDPAVSSHHAIIHWSAGDFILEDRGSANGTYVNGQQLTSARSLQPGDEIRLGDTLMIFRRLAPYRRGGPRGAPNA